MSCAASVQARGMVAAAIIMLIPLSRACAQQSDDGALDRIPHGLLDPQDEAPPASAALGGTAFLEEAPEYLHNRTDLAVPLPGGNGPDWANRLFVDARGQWAWSQQLKAVYSVRAEYYVQQGGAFSTDNNSNADTLNYDLREAYLSGSPDSARQWFVDFGRINVRNGAAYGFNPTDFFRKQSVIDEVSQDPSVLRDNRLGTLMVRGQYLSSGNSLTALFAPKMYEALAIDGAVSTWDPQLRRTNAQNRLEITDTYDFGHDLNPQAVLYHEGSIWSYGLNLTHGLGKQTTAYVEWSASRRRNLIDEALRYAVDTGTFADADSPLSNDSAPRFSNDLAAGVSYTTQANVDFILEYDLHQAGFSKSDWVRWFAAGTATSADRLVWGKLWYLRAYASVQQEPVNRQSLFLRIAKDDFLVPHLSVSALSIVDLTGPSTLVQADLGYRFSSRLQAQCLYQTTVGKARSDFGSDPVANAVYINLKWYL
jgi:hypothetical protein